MRPTLELMTSIITSTERACKRSQINNEEGKVLVSGGFGNLTRFGLLKSAKIRFPIVPNKSLVLQMSLDITSGPRFTQSRGLWRQILRSVMPLNAAVENFTKDKRSDEKAPAPLQMCLQI